MLTLSKVSKSFAGRVLFHEASLQVNRSDRIGLVGANGAGKSTLFSLILGESQPDEGRVILERNVAPGHLPQESAPPEDGSVMDIACTGSPEIAAARHTLRGTTEDSHEHHEAARLLDESGMWRMEAKAKRVLSGLAFRQSDFDRPARELSGGWVMRAHLARLLVLEPDLLLLDEPTNHLDLESLVWFQQYLMDYPGAILTISHDREFLNRLTGVIVEISGSKLHRYRGNWDSYVAEKAGREARHLAAFKNQQKEIATLQKFADRFRAKASKASQAQSKLKQIARMDRIDAPENAEATVHFRFPQPQRSGHRVLTLEGVSHSYGDLEVYRDLDFEVTRGERTVLVGPNGAGKSTLLKLLAGVLPVAHGVRNPGHNAKCGYFSQHRIDMLNARHSVLESALDTPAPVSDQAARSVLGAFLFRGDDVFKSVSVLSGGEKTRLALARLLLDPPNLLLMDEPTTHLDVAAIDALIGALRQFEGSLVFISHDVHFIRAVATGVVRVSSGCLARFAGGYDYYLDKSPAVSARAGLTQGEMPGNHQPSSGAAPTPSAPTSPPPTQGIAEIRERRRAEADLKKADAAARRARKKKLEELETHIHSLEARQKELAAALEDPATYEPGGPATRLNREMHDVQARLEPLTAEWEALASMDSE